MREYWMRKNWTRALKNLRGNGTWRESLTSMHISCHIGVDHLDRFPV